MYVYDPKKVNVNIANHTVGGFADDSMVTCERNEDRGTPLVGAKGETAISLSADSSGTITIVLQQQSPSNAVFQDLSNRQVVFPVNVVDTNTGGMIAGGKEGFIITEPAIERGKEITTREWAIWVGDFSLKQN